MNENVMELQATIFYLKMVGRMYPIAPEKAIEAIERAIKILEGQERNQRDEPPPS